jgi:hypothetical protein
MLQTLLVFIGMWTLKMEEFTFFLTVSLSFATGGSLALISPT